MSGKKCYLPMKTEQQLEIDDLMKERYGAKRSSVTDNDWIDLKNGCWICAYVRMPESVKEKPDLYMVHYAVEYGLAGGGMVIYKSV